MSPAEIATGAFGLALLEANDDNVDPYEVMALLALKSLAMLNGRDPAAFGALINGLGHCGAAGDRSRLRRSQGY